MNDLTKPDPAAVLGAALSIWEAVKKAEQADVNLDLSEAYGGGDEFMRQVMRIATTFEAWSCIHVAFDAVAETWPYLLHARFGQACVEQLGEACLFEFVDDDCLPLALALDLPVKNDDALPVPICVTVENTVGAAAFVKYRIETYRDMLDDDNEPYAFTSDVEPYDANYGIRYFRLSGITADGIVEPIANRATYAEAVALARKISSPPLFPEVPTSTMT